MSCSTTQRDDQKHQSTGELKRSELNAQRCEHDLAYGDEGQQNAGGEEFRLQSDLLPTRGAFLTRIANEKWHEPNRVRESPS